MKIAGVGQNVFPLVNVNSRLTGYYLDDMGFVFSTRRGGDAQRLAGSKTAAHRRLYFTLANSNYLETLLVSVSKNHPLWHKEINGPQNTVPLGLHNQGNIFADLSTGPKVSTMQNQPSKAARSHSTSVANGIKDRGVIIAHLHTKNGVDSIIVNPNPAIHNTTASWENELERLALLSPGTKYIALKILGGKVASGLTEL